MKNATKKKIKAIIVLILFLESTGFSPCFAIKNKAEKINKKDYINIDFWEKYDDNNLNYFILRAIESNYDLKIAEKNTQIYKELIGISISSELPSIGGGFSPSYNKMPNTTKGDSFFAFPLYVNWEADIFLKNKDKILISRKDYEMSMLDEKSAYISIASMTGSIYFNILKLNKAIEIQNEIVELKKEILRLTTMQHKEGIISYQEVIRAQKAYINGVIDLTEFKKQRLTLINALCVLIGENPGNAENFSYSDIEKIEFKGIIPNEINSNAIIYRPDYIKAEKNIEKAGLNVRVAKKEFLPSINLTGLALFNSGDFSKLLTTKSALLGLGGIITGDLFSGGQKIANLKIKKSQYEIALQNYEKTNLIAIQEINDSMIAINHDKTKYNDTKEQNNLELKDYNLHELKFNNGTISKLDLIRAKESLLSVKLLMLFNKTDCFIDYISLYKALGAKIDNL